MLSFTWLPPYNKIVVFWLALSYIVCDTYQNKKLIYFEFVRSHNLKKLQQFFMQLFNIGTFQIKICLSDVSNSYRISHLHLRARLLMLRRKIIAIYFGNRTKPVCAYTLVAQNTGVLILNLLVSNYWSLNGEVLWIFNFLIHCTGLQWCL